MQLNVWNIAVLIYIILKDFTSIINTLFKSMLKSTSSSQVLV